MSFSGTSTVASVHRGAAEAPRGTGARATREEDEVMSRLALAMGVSCLVTISGPVAQEEARVRALRRAQLLSALKEKTAGIPGRGRGDCGSLPRRDRRGSSRSLQAP